MRVMVWRMQVVDVPDEMVKADFLERNGGRLSEVDLLSVEEYLENHWVEYSSDEVLSDDGQRLVRAEVLDSAIIVEPYVDDRLPVEK